jgi:hypothetical protein
MILTHLVLFGFFPGATAGDVEEESLVGGRPRRYTYTLPNGVRINGTRAEVNAAVKRFETPTSAKPREVLRETKPTEKPRTLPSEILAAMSERVPLNIVEPPAPVAIPDFDPIRDDEAVLVLLLA